MYCHETHKKEVCSRAQQILFSIITKGYSVLALVSHHQAWINPNQKRWSAEDGIFG
jgi:hypothetical protein